MSNISARIALSRGPKRIIEGCASLPASQEVIFRRPLLQKKTGTRFLKI